jgi:iron complex outermembrane recepter protein
MKKNLLLKFLAFFLLFPLSNVFSQQNNESDSSTVQKVFTLGEISVYAKRENANINAKENLLLNRMQIASSLNTLPSITLANSGGRNDATVYLRGFDLRQIPVFLDGIPIYVAYDGYIDMARFTTANLAEINVSKGFSSILYGPNTLGGAINLITSKPQSRFSVDAIAGIMSGKGYKSSINLGSRFGKYYVQLNASTISKDYYELSEKYHASSHEDGGNRVNSYNKDSQVGVKFGYTPNSSDEYSINLSYQHGEKGTPPYTGTDPTIKTRYWQWPVWDKKSLYFISKTRIEEKTYMKTRLFVDLFENELNSFDDSTYSTQTRAYAFTSIYNDRTAGAFVEAGTTRISKNLLKLAIHYKNDLHAEHNLNEPVRYTKDNTYSVGVEDVFNVSPILSLTPGISYNLRNSNTAEEYFSALDSIAYFPANSSNAINEQIGINLNISPLYSLYLTLAKKTRFATMKDRYSYKLGNAIPNPGLNPENALNLEFGLNGSSSSKYEVLPSVFYSRIYDVIQQINNVEPGRSQMQNSGTAVFYGGEITGSYNFSEKFKTGLNYTFIKRQNISQPDVKFTDVPEHKLFGYILMHPIKRLDVSFSGEYNSKRYSTSYGNIAEDYTLFNFRMGAQIVKFISLEAGINNIFDTNYCLSEGYPEQGRNFYTSLIFKL